MFDAEPPPTKNPSHEGSCHGTTLPPSASYASTKKLVEQHDEPELGFTETSSSYDSFPPTPESSPRAIALIEGSTVHDSSSWIEKKIAEPFGQFHELESRHRSGWIRKPSSSHFGEESRLHGQIFVCDRGEEPIVPRKELLSYEQKPVDFDFSRLSISDPQIDLASHPPAVPTSSSVTNSARSTVGKFEITVLGVSASEEVVTKPLKTAACLQDQQACTRSVETTITDSASSTVDASWRYDGSGDAEKIVVTKPCIPLHPHPQRQNVVLGVIVPYDVVYRLHTKPGKCVASTASSPYRRCMGNTKWTQADTVSLLNMFQERQEALNLISVAPMLRKISVNAMCASQRCNHGKNAQHVLDELLAMASGSIADQPSGVVKSVPQWSLLASTLEYVPHWLNVLNESFLSLVKILRPSELSKNPEIGTRQILTNKITDEKTSQPTIRKVFTQNFSVHCPSKHDQNLALEEALRHSMCEPLNWREESATGSIYAYWLRGNFGYMKIGVTTRSVDARLREWGKTCKLEMDELKLMSTSNDVEQLNFNGIAHLYRVERCIQTELRDHRRQTERCVECKRKHTEWFEVSSEMAKEVLLKWTNWMNSRPYANRDSTALGQSDDGKVQIQAPSISGGKRSATRTVVATNKAASERTLKKQPRTRMIHGIKMVDVDGDGVYVQALPLAASVTDGILAEMCTPIKPNSHRLKPRLSSHRSGSRLSRSSSPCGNPVNLLDNVYNQPRCP